MLGVWKVKNTHKKWELLNLTELDAYFSLNHHTNSEPEFHGIRLWTFQKFTIRGFPFFVLCVYISICKCDNNALAPNQIYENSFVFLK